jgi:hypothetical protein
MNSTRKNYDINIIILRICFSSYSSFLVFAPSFVVVVRLYSSLLVLVISRLCCVFVVVVVVVRLYSSLLARHFSSLLRIRRRCYRCSFLLVFIDPITRCTWFDLVMVSCGQGSKGVQN